MELKKNERANLSKWYSTIFNLGLLLSVGTVLVAFEWKAKEEKPLVDLTKGMTNWETEMVPITIQTPPPVTPPPVVPPVIKIVDEENIPDDTFNFDINQSIDEPIPEIKLEEPPTADVADEIIDFTEVKAQFQGGMDAWYAYLRKNLSYPKQAQKMGIEGTVILRFVINTDGSIQDAVVIRSVDPVVDKAAIDVILNSPPWKAAWHHGRPVRSRMTIPIKFKLN